MRRTLWLTCGVLGGMIGLTVFAENEGELAPEPQSIDGAAVDAPAPTPAYSDPGEEPFDNVRFRFPQESPAFAPPAAPAALQDEAEEVSGSVEESIVQEVDDLRKQYRKLIDEKSNLMDRSTLRQAISSTEQDIDELKASAKLEDAKQQLLELVKSHPETKAAQAARMMLQASPERRLDAPPYSSSPFAAPTPGAPYYEDNSKSQSPTYESEPYDRTPEETTDETIRKKK